MNAKRKGMLVDILRSSLGDCTNGGISSTKHNHRYFLLVGPGVPELNEERDDFPVVVLVKRPIYGDFVRPADDGRWPMMGGNWVYSSDSRYRQLFGGPLPLHDRFE